ncbi:hypothetical protein ACN42_g277 [Penicillium freii]|uniref:Uncharacterized protein n=1 Tax=Penicillium freii TaxID=48697 RepID=A0A117NSU2_PENFR|nr:hypothetical protein ACN42_g277 [Penicillium freii]
MLPVMGTWTILSAFLLRIPCSSNPWCDISDAECGGLRTCWEVITPLDICTEILLLVYAALAIRQVTISTKQKILVFCALEGRILLIPFAAVRLRFILVQP